MKMKFLSSTDILHDKDTRMVLDVLYQKREHGEKIRSQELYKESKVGNDKFYNKILPSLKSLGVIKKVDEKGNEITEKHQPTYIELQKKYYDLAYLAHIIDALENARCLKSMTLPFLKIFGIPKNKKIRKKMEKKAHIVRKNINELYLIKIQFLTKELFKQYQKRFGKKWKEIQIQNRHFSKKEKIELFRALKNIHTEKDPYIKKLLDRDNDNLRISNKEMKQLKYKGLVPQFMDIDLLRDLVTYIKSDKHKIDVHKINPNFIVVYDASFGLDNLFDIEDKGRMLLKSVYPDKKIDDSIEFFINKTIK